MYKYTIMGHNNNGDMMIDEFKQKIDCCVRDCVHCVDGCHCNLQTIQITKDIRNENTMYNTICQSYEEE